jgi:diguanylate cyclase (GGDEF)-like protein
VSQMITNELIRQHVRMHFKVDKNLPDAIYNGMFYEGIEKASVWVNVVEQVCFDEAFIKKGLKNAACMLITSCLTIETMNRFISVANKMNISVFIGGASLMEVSKLKDINGKVDYYFINENEMNRLMESLDCTSWGEVAQKKQANFIITKGGEGAELQTADGICKFYKTTEKEVSGNVLGAGDLFMSVAIKEMMFHEKTLDESIEQGMKISSQILARTDANMGTYNPLAANIQMVTDRAHHDKLTGALNRHGIERYLTTPNLDVNNLHMLVVDADHFKKINDTYGHDVGDEALVSLVQVIQSMMRKNDIVARFGGEEFICLLKNMSSKQAEAFAQRILKSIAEKSHTSRQLNLTVSIGLCRWGRNERLEDVIKRADEALYKAKDTGRNVVVKG